MLALAASSADNVPVIVLAERQTTGRGRGNNRWAAGSGALTFSLVVSAGGSGLPLQQRPHISLAAGLAVCEALCRVFPQGEFGLKWPNDVFLNGGKVSGILVEVPPQSPELSVIGIGINVNNRVDEMPAEIQHTAASLIDAAGATFDLNDVLIPVLESISDRLEMLQQNRSELPGLWHAYCLLRDRRVQIQAGANTTVGQCRGIADDGAPLLETLTGTQRIYGGVVARID